MDEPVWSTLENSNEVTSLNSTTALSVTWKTSERETVSVSLQVVGTVGMILLLIGSCANSVVLAVLVRARRHFGSNVHTLIANQSAADLFACVFGICSLVVMIAHGEKYNGDDIFEATLCVVFGGGALTAVGLTADIIGLMVITLERYFKIVHAIAHRKYYRNWMTKVGVVLPWIGGVCLILFTGIGTTRIVNGRCMTLGVWPNEATAKAFAVIRFLVHYAIPVSVFAFCYGRIFHTIRRQSKVVGGHMARSQEVPMATTSRDQNAGQVQQQATGDSTGNKLSRTELNVLKTMITVIVCFLIFWSVPDFANLFKLLGMPTLDYNAFLLSGSLAYISFCVNPFIYASRYEVFRRQLKQMLNKNAVTPSSAGGTTNTSHPAIIQH